MSIILCYHSAFDFTWLHTKCLHIAVLLNVKLCLMSEVMHWCAQDLILGIIVFQFSFVDLDPSLSLDTITVEPKKLSQASLEELWKRMNTTLLVTAFLTHVVSFFLLLSSAGPRPMCAGHPRESIWPRYIRRVLPCGAERNSNRSCDLLTLVFNSSTSHHVKGMDIWTSC